MWVALGLTLPLLAIWAVLHMLIGPVSVTVPATLAALALHRAATVSAAIDHEVVHVRNVVRTRRIERSSITAVGRGDPELAQVFNRSGGPEDIFATLEHDHGETIVLAVRGQGRASGRRRLHTELFDRH